MFRYDLSRQGSWELLTSAERGNELSNPVYDAIQSLKQLYEVGMGALYVEKLKVVASSIARVETCSPTIQTGMRTSRSNRNSGAWTALKLCCEY